MRDTPRLSQTTFGIKASEDIFGAPQFECPPQTFGLDPPLLAAYALSCLCIPVSNAVAWASEGFFPRGGGSRGFSQKFFQWGAKSGEIWFLPLSKLKKQQFFANNFKIQGGKALLPPLPTPMCSCRMSIQSCYFSFHEVEKL